MRITVNGEEHDVEPGATVDELVARLCPSTRGVAVAIGREVVPRSAWPATEVAEGDRLEIVTAAAGG